MKLFSSSVFFNWIKALKVFFILGRFFLKNIFHVVFIISVDDKTKPTLKGFVPRSQFVLELVDVGLVTELALNNLLFEQTAELTLKII